MKKTLVAALCSLFAICAVNAQSKVFKEVNDEISSQMKVIMQDDALVGYLVFTQLEKSSEDFFNYRITIMDENLNDIGKVDFKEEKIELQAVSFDEDILCLAYLKNNIYSKRSRNTAKGGKNEIFTQFLNLDGKIIKTNSTEVDIRIEKPALNKSSWVAKLKHGVQLKNIPQKGFACFYADYKSQNLMAFDFSGKQLWKKSIPEAEGFSLLTSGESIYLLTKRKDKMLEGGYSVLAYSVANGAGGDKIALQDKKGNQLKVLAFENDKTGKPFISGNIIDSRKGHDFYSGKQIARGTYSGVFTIKLNGLKKSDVKEVYSYWDDGSQSGISKKGFFVANNSYGKFYQAITDYEGNTYFVGSSFIKKPKWGNIASSIVLSPLVVFSPFILMAGTTKCKITNPILIKQASNGSLSFENSIAANNSRFFRGATPFSVMDNRSYYNVSNSSTKTNYLIVDDVKDIIIYNIKEKKVMRTVSHKDGKLRTDIFPGKEGHIVVREYNKQEKYTRLSIERL